MKVKEYKDGIAFLSDDLDREIAFYSIFTNRITYSIDNDSIYDTSVNMSYADNLRMMDAIIKYRRKHSNEISYDNDYQIIDNTYSAQREFGFKYGKFDFELTSDEIQSIQNGKCLAMDINCGEYSAFVTRKEDE